MCLQECDVGYTRSSSGLYLGTCDRCDCNGHANGCDSETGRCLVSLHHPHLPLRLLVSVLCDLCGALIRAQESTCLHNTAGPRCEHCQTGFYGNPVTGGAQACQPCPCPGTASSNQFSSTCHLEADGQPTCDHCPPGFTGRSCEGEEKPPADSCDDPFLEKQIEGLLPVGCGAEAVFNFSWEKQIFPYGSGDDDETAGTTVLPSQTLFSAAIHHRTTRETKSTGWAMSPSLPPTDYPPGSPLASPPVRRSDTPAYSTF
ncbi:hypothetical protein JOQ06_028130 [Pogonophryne albipinna]|uniref:Laminin EGF-like domain-containing protein n=1 Tax=Pogonophryne albipinna TaxID=1090488 RepID=A0AAD6AFZ3_9TELE|nr:hypothetical protein JOQ06_028130 [Pogonophryne albipinna]